MIQSKKDQAMLTSAPQPNPDHARNMGAMTERLGLNTAPAAWPTGVSLLAQAVDACQRCDADTMCTDWLARAPKAVAAPPAFCSTGPRFKLAKRAKERG